MAPPHETLARTCTCQIHGVVDKAWAIIDHLEGKARNYIINKSEPERNDPGKIFSHFCPVDLEVAETRCT